MLSVKVRRDGFTLLELLVAIAIIAILIALLVPSVQRVRESAAAVQCKNNLKEIALATIHFHDANRAFPPARIVERPLSTDPPALRWGGKHPSWLVRILPFIDQQVAAEDWDVTKPYNDHADSARLRPVPSYLCPTRRISGDLIVPTASQMVTLPCGCQFPGETILTGVAGDYAGNHGDLTPSSSGLPTDFYWGGNGTGVIISSRGNIDGRGPRGWVDRVRILDIPDGVSNTILAGELHVPSGKLASAIENGPIFDGTKFYTMSRVGGPGVPIANGPNDSLAGMGLFAFGSWHPGVTHFAFADGRVVAIAPTINPSVLERVCNRADGESVPDL